MRNLFKFLVLLSIWSGSSSLDLCASTCAEALVKSIGFFDMHNPRVVSVSKDSQEHEPDAISTTLSLYVTSVLSRNERIQLARYLQNELEVSDLISILPLTALEGLNALPDLIKLKVIKDLLDIDTHDMFVHFDDYFGEVYRHIADDIEAYERAITDLDIFFKRSKDLSSVYQNSRIEVDELRRVVFSRSHSDEDLFKEGLAPLNSIHEVLFSITYDSQNKKYFLRLTPAIRGLPVAGFVNHATNARSSKVVYSGEIYLMPNGQIAAVNLVSGHFMFSRSKRIELELEALASDDFSLQDLLEAAHELDRKNIQKIFEEAFSLEFAENSPFKRKVYVSLQEWNAAFDSSIYLEESSVDGDDYVPGILPEKNKF